MSSVLDRFLSRSAGRTLPEQPDPEARTGRTKSQILTREPGSDRQSTLRAGLTLSEYQVYL